MSEEIIKNTIQPPAPIIPPGVIPDPNVDPPEPEWPKYDESKEPDIINGWKYDPNFPEIDNVLTPDDEISGRFTFERRLYFKPFAYDNWSKGRNYDGHSYLANIIGNKYLPLDGQPLSATSYFPDKTGPIGNFYMSKMISMDNLTSENSEATSYAVVTYEYENMPPPASRAPSFSKPVEYPWKEVVKDFTITNQQESNAFISGYIQPTGEYVALANTAGQPLYGNTTSMWTRRVTWTFNDLPKYDYSISRPVINSKDTWIMDKIWVQAGDGLLLPPGVKSMWFVDKWGREREYYQWSFEVIINPRGHQLNIANVGTKALDADGNQFDIYAWDFTYNDYNGSGKWVSQRRYGDFSEFTRDKSSVKSNNESYLELNKMQHISGGPVQPPGVPLTAKGHIDKEAIKDPNKRLIMVYERYKRGEWNLGERW